MAQNQTQTAPSAGSATTATLLVNTKSRMGQDWFEDSQKKLGELGISLDRAEAYEDAKKLISAVGDLTREGSPLVIVGGGDGTLSAVAKFFCRSESTLGVLPLGTGNSFARDMGIPVDVAQACKVIATGKAVKVDVGEAGDRIFLNVVTAGLSTRIARSLDGGAKHRFGKFVYAAALIKALRGSHPFVARLDTDNGQVEFETLQVVIGNGHYHAGPFPLSPTARITEGKLSIYALKGRSKMAFFKMAALMPSGHQGDLDDVHREEATAGRFTAAPNVSTTIDGEVCDKTPIEFKVHPAALRVMAPPEFKG